MLIKGMVCNYSKPKILVEIHFKHGKYALNRYVSTEVDRITSVHINYAFESKVDEIRKRDFLHIGLN